MTLRDMTHEDCTQSLREDLAHGLIYGPYAEPTDQIETCSVCKGSGSYASYSLDAVNGDKAGQPAPCEFCSGKGEKPILRFLTMAEWAKRTGLCVYCGTPRNEE